MSSECFALRKGGTQRMNGYAAACRLTSESLLQACEPLSEKSHARYCLVGFKKPAPLTSATGKAAMKTKKQPAFRHTQMPQRRFALKERFLRETY